MISQIIFEMENIENAIIIVIMSTNKIAADAHILYNPPVRDIRQIHQSHHP